MQLTPRSVLLVLVFKAFLLGLSIASEDEGVGNKNLRGGASDEEDDLQEARVVRYLKRPDDIISGAYIVRFRDDMSAADVPGYAAAKARVANLVPSFVYQKTIKGFAVRGSQVALEKILGDDADILSIEPDRVVTVNAPPPGKGKGGGGGVGSGGEEIPWGIPRVNGGGIVDYSDPSFHNKAYVLDTGIDLNHEDLNVDPTQGYNAITNGPDSRTLDDGSGHGTHVAGTIAAISGNGVGVVGVAPGATVVPVKVLDRRGYGTYSGVIAGIEFVAREGRSGDVANMSLGGTKSLALNEAVKTAANYGIKFVLAAGNDSKDANEYSPASANHPNIYTISAMDQNDKFAYWSNYGNPPVDYCAPGVNIKSTWKDNGYNTISGTSMAAPHAAGVLLLESLTAGSVTTNGSVNGDRDGDPDPIISFS